MAENCPSITDWKNYRIDSPSGHSQSHLAKHLETCTRCQVRLGIVRVAPWLAELETPLRRLDHSAGEGYCDDETRAISSPSNSTGLRGQKDLGTYSDQPARQPTHCGGYSVQRLIGGGGMGKVYLATLATSPDERFAVKVVREDLVGSPNTSDEVIQRYRQEIRLLSRLSHPNVVRILDVGDDEELPYFVMPFLDGCNGKDLLRRHAGAVPLGITSEVILQAASGLRHAHENDILHRDVKPANLILTSGFDGWATVQVVDFGLAVGLDPGDDFSRFQGTNGNALGTPSFQSPEQRDGTDRLGPATDCFGLGMVLAYLLGEQVSVTMLADPNRVEIEFKAGVPQDVQSLMGQMLAPNASDRISDLTEVIAVLSRHATPFRIDRKVNTSQALSNPGTVDAKHATDAMSQVSLRRVTPAGNGAPRYRRRSIVGWAGAGVAGLAACLVAISLLSPTGVTSGVSVTKITPKVDAGLASPGTIPDKSQSWRQLVANVAQSAESGLSVGFDVSDYAPQAPADGVIDVDVRGRQHDASTRHLFFETPPGHYRIQLVNDVREFLGTPNSEVLFYRDGDRAKTNPETGTTESQPFARLEMPSDPAVEFDVQPGTSKLSVVPAWTLEAAESMTPVPDSRRIPNTHTICVFYSYPDLTFVDAKLADTHVHAGDEVVARLNVVNVGVVAANAGAVQFLMRPVGSQTRHQFSMVDYPSLAPGESFPVEARLPIASRVRQAEHEVSVVIDAKQSTHERDELAYGCWVDMGGEPFLPVREIANAVPYNNEWKTTVRVSVASDLNDAIATAKPVAPNGE